MDQADGLLLLEAYFAAETVENAVRLRLPAGVVLVAEEAVEDRDWLETYRQQAVPRPVGTRLLLDPREPDVEPPATHGRILLRLPARQAFGTGSHESTRLILELMEATDLAGGRVLDVGSGSGVLCFAALAFGAARTVGLEIDLPSAFMAWQNRELNDLHPYFVAGGLEVCGAARCFDVALVNILPERILPSFHFLPPLLEDDADLLLSGIVEERSKDVLSTIAAWDFHPVDELREGEWVAFRCRR